MFHKIIIAEDIDLNNIGIQNIMKNLGIGVVHTASTCDEAFLKIRKAEADRDPYELLVTDLSFKAGQLPGNLVSGEMLIAAVCKDYPKINIVVYSIDNRPFMVRSLFQNFGINGYVEKGLRSIPKLEKAIAAVFDGTTFISPDLAHVLQDKSLSEIRPYDRYILKALANGLQVDEIVTEFQRKGIAPNGKSSVEKQINKLREVFDAHNNAHLVVKAISLGLIEPT